MQSAGMKRRARRERRKNRARRQRRQRRVEAGRLERHTRRVYFDNTSLGVEWWKYDSYCELCMGIEGGYDIIKDVPIPAYDRWIYVNNKDNDGRCLVRVYFKHGKTEEEEERYRQERISTSYPRGNPSRADK